ncbi:MAG: peptidoglycan DD-metalloendopeptidase family protein [Erythrobacter sp.]
MSRKPVILMAICAGIGIGALAALVLAVPQSGAQSEIAIMEPDEARAQLERATKASKSAEERASRFASEAEQAEEAAERTAREAAALAAQIQRSEADITAARARYSIAQAARARLSQRLASRRQPLVRLTAALQTSARRPLALSALQPGSLKDVVYVRAVLDSAVPQIRARTATLRSDLEKGRILERRALRAVAALRTGESELRGKRSELAALETRQRLALRNARGSALREEERALALAEEARDLDGLIDKLDDNAKLRRKLAALPGPVLRPAGLADGRVSAIDSADTSPDPLPTAASARPGVQARFQLSVQLPVQGRIVTGFGEERSSGLRSKGLSLVPEPGAQIVAPASGRVAFSAPYEGFGRIIIIEHDGGWTSVVTGLARIDVEVGETVIGGGPLGAAGSEDPVIGIELREDGTPVNPLDYLQ